MNLTLNVITFKNWLIALDTVLHVPAGLYAWIFEGVRLPYHMVIFSYCEWIFCHHMEKDLKNISSSTERFPLCSWPTIHFHGITVSILQMLSIMTETEVKTALKYAFITSIKHISYLQLGPKYVKRIIFLSEEYFIRHFDSSWINREILWSLRPGMSMTPCLCLSWRVSPPCTEGHLGRGVQFSFPFCIFIYEPAMGHIKYHGFMSELFFYFTLTVECWRVLKIVCVFRKQLTSKMNNHFLIL